MIHVIHAKLLRNHVVAVGVLVLSEIQKCQIFLLNQSKI